MRIFTSNTYSQVKADIPEIAHSTSAAYSLPTPSHSRGERMARELRTCSMSRRSFCRTAAGVLVAPGIAIAQGSKVRRIGFLSSGSRPSQAELQAIYAPLRQLGWIEGENVVFERRYTDGSDGLLRPYADELVRLKLDLIVTSGTAATLAAKSATKTIPIVMRGTGDPVLSGIVTSLAKPGGNITGYARLGPEVSLKQLTLVRELFPTAQRVAWLENAANPYYRAARKQIENASQSLAILSLFIEVAKTDELDQAIAEATSQHARAIILQDDALLNDSYDNLTRFFRAALKYGTTRLARTRCSAWLSCCSTVFTGTKRIPGRPIASQIASASAASFLLLFT